MKVASLIPAFLITTSVVLATTSMPASAVTFGFSNIAGGDTVGDAYNSNFSFDVIQSSSDTVLFQFSNTGSVEHALKQFAFSIDNSVSGLLSNMMVNVGNVGTVNFNGNPQNLSQSNNILGWDGTTFGGGKSGKNSNSLQPGETLGVSFTANYNNVIAALNARTLQVGIHVGSLPGGASDSYVNSSPISQSVPEPGTIVGVMAFGIAGLLTRKNSKNEKLENIKA
ncbi:MAG: PEP-CTERM sorting domain-containing protein [Mojavia pulchra JT2-VF2]|jgi:hypothetical protein|uniref:PEP-CTERM sorting domain-containing protein n=1 Tax=Mojavia pulchra JT2-VF2 TaxID=287848 RepID=A0A951Q3H2_9NOST|nr:PEP-CTERM sorting domain-containing protein [Mojavia pulchra JT2-VF2]